MVLQAEEIRKQQSLRAEAKKEATIREAEGQAKRSGDPESECTGVLNQSRQPKLTMQSSS